MSDDDLGAEPDESLVGRFRATGDNQYFAALVRRHGRAILGHCNRVLGSGADAEEVTQDTFLTAFRKIHLYRGGAFASWLHTIACNQCLNRLNSRIAAHEGMSLDSVLRTPSTASFEARSELADEVRSVLNELSAPQRVSLRLFYIEGYSYREVVQRTGFSWDEVKSHLQNGRRRFRSVWESRHPARECKGQGRQGTGIRGRAPGRLFGDLREQVPCPETEVLAKFARGELSGQESATIKAPVASCGLCDCLLERAREFRESPDEAAPPRRDNGVPLSGGF